MPRRPDPANETSTGPYAHDVDERARRAFAALPARRPVALLACWSHPDRASAQRAEAAFRKLGRRQKLALLATDRGTTAG